MRSFGRPRVLVCDDEDSVRVVCARGLTKAGYDSVLVATGAEAIAAAARESFDAYVLDVKLPDLDGLEVLSHLRTLDPDTPCVVISGHTDFAAAVELLRRGAADFLAKPFDLTAFVSAVDRVMASTHLKVDSALLAATQSIFSSLDAQEIVRRVLGVVSTLLGASRAAVFLVNPPATYRLDFGKVTSSAGHSIPAPALTRLLTLRDPVLLSTEVASDAELVEILAPGAGTVCAQRLAVGEQQLGVLCAARSAAERGLGDGDLRRMMTLAGHVALALENARLHSVMSAQAKTLEQTLDRLVVAERIATVGRLATGIGHEVANPTCAVLAHLEIAKEHLAMGLMRQVDEDLDRATVGAKAILDVCNALRPLAGSSPVDNIVDLRQVLDGALFLASSELKGRARVVLDFPAKFPPLIGNQAKLGQVFLNLFLNAAQAMTERSPTHEMRVEAESSATTATVRVADTGKGVPPDMLPRLFEPSVTTKTSGSGHGMGLAICRWILEEMGGTIRCIPRAKGTIFEVVLPLRTKMRRVD